MYDAVAAAGVQFYLSGGSSNARGLTQADIDGKNVLFASPNELIRLAVAHDRMFTY